jgi:hypothetical protein
VPGGIDLDQPGIEFRGSPRDDAEGFRRLGSSDDPSRRLDDSRFLARNLLDRMPEKILVVEIDWRKKSHLGLHDVGGIEAAAEPDFVNREINLAIGECEKSNGGDALEKRRMRSELARSHQRFDCGVDARPCGGKGRVRNLLAVNANAFVDSFEVRRGVKTRSKTCCSQDRFDHRCRRAFAVCSGDVHARDRKMWITEFGGQNPNVLEAEFLDESPRCGAQRWLPWRREFSSQGQKRADGFLIIHEGSGGVEEEIERLRNVRLQLVSRDDGVEKAVF